MRKKKENSIYENAILWIIGKCVGNVYFTLDFDEVPSKGLKMYETKIEVLLCKSYNGWICRKVLFDFSFKI